MKHSTKYLYGELGFFYKFLQKVVAKKKIKCCNREKALICSVEPKHRDLKRYTAVIKAREFNEKILKEVE